MKTSNAFTRGTVGGVLVSSALCLLLVAPTAGAQSAPAHKMATPASAADHGLTWGPAPAIFPKGAELAVLQGDPGAAALFTIRLRVPDGYRLPPHTHPKDELVTVISGTFQVGMGEKVKLTEMQSLTPGAFVQVPANSAHYAQAKGTTVVQVHAMGPFALTYVNPADTPQAATRK